MTKSRRSYSFVCLRILVSTSCLVSFSYPVHAQDAFGSGYQVYPTEGDYFYTYTGATGTQQVDLRDPAVLRQMPTLQGSTNGVLVPKLQGVPGGSCESIVEGENSAIDARVGDRMPRDQYDKLVTMPDPRDMLGASICDLTVRDMAGEEEPAPANLPPMPRAISLPVGVSADTVHIPRGEEFGASVINFTNWNLGSTAYSVRRRVAASGTPSVDGSDDIYIDKDLMEHIMDVGSKCGANDDYTTRIAALGLKYSHPECRTVVAPDFLIDVQSKLDPPEIQELKRTLSFREHVAAIPASTLNPAQRASLAAKLEGEHKLFDALVERLSVVDANSDGPSRYYLARLYCQINENKLAYETLKEALEGNWKKSERPILQKTYNLIGNILLTASRKAERLGHHDLSLLRLRNASVALRRAIVLDPNDENAVDGLLKIAKQAIVANPGFDNYLLLGSAQMLFGDREKAELSYSQCAQLSPNDPRLRLAKVYKKQLKPNSELARKAAAIQIEVVH
ncbi:hypothetical protein BH11CYA1_BH11CYA1_48880 [soil metagenome]